MTTSITSVVRRRALGIVSDRLQVEPVVAVQGPRAVGKSFLMQAIAADRNVAVYDLDDAATQEAVQADPSLYASTDPPVCFDEYQKAPAVLSAIKSELNRDRSPGRFLLAGSTTQAALPILSEALTGRVHFVELLPFSQGEILGIDENFVEALFDSPEGVLKCIGASVSATSREQYIEKIIAGGFPIPLSRPTQTRGRWFDDYIRQTLEKDVRAISRVRARGQLRALLDRLAGQTAQLLNISKAASDMGMADTTAETYTRLLEAVYLIRRLPAWRKTLRARSAQKPKLHVVDSGVAAQLLRLTPEKLSSLDPSALQQFGHLLETFVVNELIKQASWLDEMTWGHWRTHDESEVDFVIEDRRGKIIGFEIKSSRQVSSKDFAGLRSLRAAVGQSFLAGVVLHLGEHSYTQEPQMHVLPVDRLWTRI